MKTESKGREIPRECLVPRRWVPPEEAGGAGSELEESLGVLPLTARILARRGFSSPGEAEDFLSPALGRLPDPALLPGLERAAGRIAEAARSGETVWVYTDYDVDGVTSAAVLTRFMAMSGIACRARLPRRDVEGYGLSGEVLKEIALSGGKVLVTADCGITAVAEARLARELGVDLLITDHHLPGEEMPEATAVVNPRLPGSDPSLRDLAGVGVAWYLASAVRRQLRREGRFGKGPEPDLGGLLDLVALGTVADVAPLRGANRILVSHGLRLINGASARPGVMALKAAAGLRRAVTAGGIGFSLAPRLNAAGRMEGPQEALDLLCSDDAGEARLIAERLDGMNQARQREERSILVSAVERVEAEGWYPGRWSLVLESDRWHAGVIGIVASRLAERYHRPVVLLAVEGGEAKGSARSIAGLHLVESLSHCGDLLERFGGHAAAAGLSLAADRVGRLRECFEESVRSRLGAGDLVPVLKLDAAAAFGELSLRQARELERMAPFGMGNPRPVLHTPGVKVCEMRPMGGRGDGLIMVIEHDGCAIRAKLWGKKGMLAGVAPGSVVDVAYRVETNSWSGRETVELVIEDLRRGEGRPEGGEDQS